MAHEPEYNVAIHGAPMTEEDIQEGIKAAKARSERSKEGLYPGGKYLVHRIDGRDQVGEKHEGCQYFVLDVTHDPYAVPALLAYAKACRSEYPTLSGDICEKLLDRPRWNDEP